MIGCLVLAFALCQPGYAQQGYYVQPQPQYAYVQPQQQYVVPPPPVYYYQPVPYVQPVVRLNFGGWGGHGHRW